VKTPSAERLVRLAVRLIGRAVRREVRNSCLDFDVAREIACMDALAAVSQALDVGGDQFWRAVDLAVGAERLRAGEVVWPESFPLRGVR
jgi:hypothetical protein